MGASSARAGVQFDAAHAFQIFADSRWEGSNRHFGFMTDLGDTMQAGYFFEEGNWDWRADVGELVPNFVNTSVHINGLRLLRKLNNTFSAGLDIGTAQISVTAAGGTTATLAGANRINQTKPFADIFVRGEHSFQEKGRMTSGLRMDVGYRFLDINDVTAAANIGHGSEKTLDDLNALIIGLGVFIGF